MSLLKIFSNDYLHKKSVRLFNEGCEAMKQEDYFIALNFFLDSLKLLEKTNINQSKKDELIVSVLSLIARVRGKLNQFELAEQELMRAITINPQDQDLFHSLGSLKLNQSQFEKAIPIYEKTIELNRFDPDGYFFKGVCLMELKRYQEAIRDFEKVLEINPNNVDTLFYIAFIYEELKDYKMAIVFYDKMILMNNTDNRAFVNRGNCKIELGQKVEGCIDFNQALKLGDNRVQENIDEYCKS